MQVMQDAFEAKPFFFPFIQVQKQLSGNAGHVT